MLKRYPGWRTVFITAASLKWMFSTIFIREFIERSKNIVLLFVEKAYGVTLWHVFVGIASECFALPWLLALRLLTTEIESAVSGTNGPFGLSVRFNELRIVYVEFLLQYIYLNENALSN